MRWVFRHLVFGAAFAMAVDCGGESERVVEPRPKLGRVPDPPPSAEELELARAQCDYLERCDADAMFLFANESRAACEEYFSCQAANPPWERANALPVTLEECVESLRSGDCPDYLRTPFRRFSTGVFPWGRACGVPDLADRLAPPPDAPLLGETCLRAGSSERAVCEPSTDCIVGDTPTIGQYYCGVCQPRVAIGDSCGGEIPCVEGAACVLGTCRVLRDLGEPCEVPDECLTYSCESSVCVPSTFAPTPFAEVVDRPCDENGQCGQQLALFCDEGTCRVLAGEGERCDDRGGPFCRLGHQCTYGRCLALGCRIDIGEPCKFYCEAGGCDDGECKPADELGDPCTFRCENGLHCSYRLLECMLPLPENGAPCDFDDDCASDFCARELSDACEDGLCTVPSCGGCGTCADPPTIDRCE